MYWNATSVAEERHQSGYISGFNAGHHDRLRHQAQNHRAMDTHTPELQGYAEGYEQGVSAAESDLHEIELEDQE